MKISTLIAVLFIGAIVYYVTGAGALFGFVGGSNSDESTRRPSVEIIGDYHQNPFVTAESDRN